MCQNNSGRDQLKRHLHLFIFLLEILLLQLVRVVLGIVLFWFHFYSFPCLSRSFLVTMVSDLLYVPVQPYVDLFPLCI